MKSQLENFDFSNSLMGLAYDESVCNESAYDESAYDESSCDKSLYIDSVGYVVCDG